MIILVNGLLTFNSGKTSVALALLHRAREQGLDLLAMKPRSSHNYWEHFDHSRRCQERGLLVSRDALLLRDLCPDPPAPELVNPHHQVVCPLDLLRAQEGRDDLVGRRDEMILAERLTDPEGRSTLFVNKRADRFVAPPAFLDALREGAHRVVPFSTSPAEEELAPFQSHVRGVFEALAAQRDHLLVESFSDAVLPVEAASDEVDLVVSVGGSLVLLYDPTELARAMDAVGPLRMAAYLRYLKPLAAFRVPHLTSAERGDPRTLMRAYGEVLDALWARLSPGT